MKKQGNLMMILRFFSLRRSLFNNGNETEFKRIKILRTINPERKYSFDEISSHIFNALKNEYQH
ncbi:MAG TPA: hypothetical protein EYG86_04160 [Crocinitomicaceae bacterium]|nr:hypothetical protein [Crocinitomicaceae bacterium]